MIEGWSILALALGYVSILFALAWYADRAGPFGKSESGRPLIYALSLAVYCTSWTFFGSVGLAASTPRDTSWSTRQHQAGSRRASGGDFSSHCARRFGDVSGRM